MKLLYLVLNNAADEWKRPPREWFEAKTQFAVVFGERFVCQWTKNGLAHEIPDSPPPAAQTPSIQPPDVVGNAVPDPIGLRRLVFKGFRATRSEPVIPANGMDGSPSRPQAASLQPEGERQ